MPVNDRFIAGNRLFMEISIELLRLHVEGHVYYIIVFATVDGVIQMLSKVYFKENK